MCTNIGAAGRSVATSGHLFIGSVSDDPYDIRTRVIVRRPKDGYAYVGTDLVPLSADVSAKEYSSSVSGAPTRGLNEKGLAFTWALAFERTDAKPPLGGLRPHDAWDQVLRRCGTVAEALDLLKALPRDFGASGMLADKEGNLAQVEAGRQGFAVPRLLSAANGGTAINVNCWIAMQADHGDRKADMESPTASNKSRYGQAQQRMAASDGHIDLAAMKSILSDHAHRERFAGENTMVRGHGFSICNHGSMRKAAFDAGDPSWGSVSAEIIDPVEGVFWYSYGWPCGEAPEFGDQMLQDRSWGTFVGFPLADLSEGVYTTLTGEMTALAARHFKNLRRFDA